MLRPENFDVYDDILHYIGNAEYAIYPDYPAGHELIGSYTVAVTGMDADGEPYDAGIYTACTLSTAIALVEQLEDQMEDE